MTHEIRARSSGLHEWLPRGVALVVGVGFVALGLWAMVGPRSFFDAVAHFEPYNQHLLQDVGAFQVGLGVVLLLGSLAARTDGLVRFPRAAALELPHSCGVPPCSADRGRGRGGAGRDSRPGFASSFRAIRPVSRGD